MNREGTSRILPFHFPNARKLFRRFQRSCASCPSLLIPGLLLAHVALSLFLFASFPLSGKAAVPSSQPEVLGCTTFAACSLEEPGHLSVRMSERVLAYLEVCEKTETDPWRRDDLRISWLTVLWSARGVPQWTFRADARPFEAAVWQVLQRHPDQVWSDICGRRRDKLGAMYAEFYDEAGSWRPDPPTTENLLGANLLNLPPKKPPMTSRCSATRQALV